MKPIRGLLYGLSFALPIWSLILVFFVAWWWIPGAIGLVLMIAAGLLDWLGRDCGYEQTVYGSEVSQ